MRIPLTNYELKWRAPIVLRDHFESIEKVESTEKDLESRVAQAAEFDGFKPRDFIPLYGMIKLGIDGGDRTPYSAGAGIVCTFVLGAYNLALGYGALCLIKELSK